jgi:hypothetical protein
MGLIEQALALPVVKTLLRYSETTSTEFLPPKGFCTLSFAAGSGSHCPSTTKRYSCRPGFTARSPAHFPSPRRASGVCSGFHSLNEPATKTCLASGLISSNETRFALGDGAFGATAIPAGVAAAALFTVVLFVFFLLVLIVTIKTTLSRKRSISSLGSPRPEQWACRPSQTRFAAPNSLRKRCDIHRNALFPRTGRLAAFVQDGQ